MAGNESSLFRSRLSALDKIGPLVPCDRSLTKAEMSLTITITEKLARARTDLRIGLPVVLVDNDIAAIFVAVETLDPERLVDMRKLGQPELVLTTRRTSTAGSMSDGHDLVRVKVPEAKCVDWLRNMANPVDGLHLPMHDVLNPPSNRLGRLDREAIRLAKSAELLPAVLVVRLADGVTAMTDRQLTIIDITEAISELGQCFSFQNVSSARVPLEATGAGRVHVFRQKSGGEDQYAVEVGHPDRSQPVLVRLHSACFTGDILGSLKCDCGEQLNAALTKMGVEGAGILLYLNQEGRGIGLANKMRAYSLQDQGFDTVEANHLLGFEDDERDFRIGAEILRSMGLTSIRLLTNNPRKVEMMEACGLKVVERISLRVGSTVHSSAYLATKAAKSGHLF